MRFLLSNQGSRLTATQVAAIALSAQTQLRYHVSAAWNVTPATVGSVGILQDASRMRLALAKRAIVVVLKPHLDVDGALGDHSVDGTGFPVAEVGVEETYQESGTILGPNGIGSVVSHEIVETFGDQFVCTWDEGPDGNEYAHELCDAVEGDGYLLNGVYMSNFVKPSFFNKWISAGTAGQFDYMGKLTAPFTMSPGGYQVVKHPDGSYSQVYGSAVTDERKAKIAKRRRVTLRKVDV